MIEFKETYFNIKDVAVTTSRGQNRWAAKWTHNPTGLFVSRSGAGVFEHQIEERRNAVEDLQQQVDKYYTENNI